MMDSFLGTLSARTPRKLPQMIPRKKSDASNPKSVQIKVDSVLLFGRSSSQTLMTDWVSGILSVLDPLPMAASRDL